MSKFSITSTVYDRKGRVLARGKNSYFKSHPKMLELSNVCDLEGKIFLHSEVLGIIRALKVGVPHKIKIERYYKNGEPALAKPCPMCERYIKESGIKLVEYTVG